MRELEAIRVAMALYAALLIVAILFPVGHPTLQAAPVAAQVNTVGLMGTDVTFNEERENGCLTAGISLTSTASIPMGTQVRYHVSTTSGFNHFRNHGVQVYLADGANLNDIPSNVITATTAAAGTSVVLPGLCVVDDRIDPRPDGNPDGNATSFITIRLMSVAGFAIDRNRDSARANVRGDDACHREASIRRNGGVIYKFRNGNMNDSCVCASKSLVEVEPHGGYTPRTPQQRSSDQFPAVVFEGIPTYQQSSLNWTNDSTDYCADSPYKPG